MIWSFLGMKIKKNVLKAKIKISTHFIRNKKGGWLQISEKWEIEKII